MNPFFHYQKDDFYIENVPLKTIAKEAGTPVYIYSQSKLLQNFKDFDSAFSNFPHLICFALKANSSLGVARTFSREGAGADIVSGGELYRALRAGFNPKKIVFSGVGKTKEEMRFALQKKILTFNIESIEELKTLNEVAASVKTKAPIAVRVNPEVDAGGHHHIKTGTSENKFGIHKKAMFDAYRLAKTMNHIDIVGLQAHIGSQITSITPFVTLLKTCLELTGELKKMGIEIKNLDLGGGLGIIYKNETPPSPFDLAEAFEPLLKKSSLNFIFEPGRFLVGNAGILATEVLYRKKSAHKNFVVINAAMNDLARPALYDAYHEIVPAKKKRGEMITADIVGPICESGDYLGKARTLVCPEQGDFLAVKSAGAYGFSMSSQYNSRPRAAEVLVSGKNWKIIREREDYEDLIRGEK